MWNAIIEGVSPHFVAGGITVSIMGVMFFIHKWRGGKHKPEDAFEVLRVRFARGEISRDEYEEWRKVLSTR